MCRSHRTGPPDPRYQKWREGAAAESSGNRRGNRCLEDGGLAVVASAKAAVG